MSYSRFNGFGASHSQAPASVAALCATRGGVVSYNESGFTFTVACADGMNCAGGAEQSTRCSGGTVHVSGGGGSVPGACPATTSADGPAGVPVYGTTSGPAPTVCNAGPGPGGKWTPYARICNSSRDPGYCFHANAFNKAWKERGSAAAVKAWQGWMFSKLMAELNPTAGGAGPSTAGPASAGPSTDWRYGINLPGIDLTPTKPPPGMQDPTMAPPPDGKSNTWLYVGLGVAAVAIVGGALYMKSKKATK